MPLLISDCKLPVTAEETELAGRIAKQCGLPCAAIKSVRVVKRALDARRKNDIHFLLRALVELEPEQERRLLKRGDPCIRLYAPKPVEPATPGGEPLSGRVAVVGLGPAGLFAALTLAEAGYAPLVLERGRPVTERALDVERFWSGAGLNPESNVLFGEGGAGTFSDGKLTSRSKDPRGDAVLATLARFGAPEEILIDAKPHIGTDRLRVVVAGIRKQIERLGGEVYFSARLTGFQTSAEGRLTGLCWTGPNGAEHAGVSAAVLAVGQGAADTYRMLYNGGVAMQKKAFAVGVRAEHPQALIDRAQFGALAGHPRLGPASYALTARSGERGVYTFCMCPGGSVIACSNGPEQVLVNGMSGYARDGVNANAAVVVQVRPEDTPDHPLAGLKFCEEMERTAYRLGGGDYRAPAERVADFLARGKPAGFGSVAPSYRPGVRNANLWDALPDFVAKGVFDGIRAFSKQLEGYDLPDAVLTAPETRTSSPLRITRDETMQSLSHPGLYPVGEGAGYAGGIVSSAIDGMRAAERIIGTYRKP